MADTATYGDTANARSHLFLCSGNTVTATAYSCFFGIFCEPIGWVTFTTTTIGLAQDPDGSARSVSQVSLLQDFLPDGPNPEAILSVPMQVSMDCTPAAGLGTACENDRPEGMTMPLAEWTTYQGGVPFNLTGPDGDGVGADLLSFYNFDTRLTLTDNGSTTTFGTGQFRCDYGRSLNTATGCVFSLPVDRFRRLSLSDPTVAAAALHVRDALFAPDSTNPPGVNKQIPGLEATKKFLTRTVDSRTIDANRRDARKACLKYDDAYKHDRRTLGLDCDEYPFASTYEGAASGGDFSVRGIPSNQNQAAGRALNAWYNTFRILDLDRFYVDVRD